MRGSQETRI